MNVGHYMTRNPVTVREDLPVPEAQALMRTEKIHRLPVVDGSGKLKGIVTASDLAKAASPAATSLDMYELHYLIYKLKVESVMAKNPRTVGEDMPIEEAARLMADNRISGLPVLRDGALVGIITESDIFKLFIELLGARHAGIRLTVLMSEKRGELARVAGAIAGAGGNIISLATFEGENTGNTFCTLKVEGLPRSALVEAVSPLVERITDVRES